MLNNKRFSIGELADAAGVSRRAVRFYVQTGVIPPPVGLGRFCFYTQEHLELIIRHRSKPADLNPDLLARYMLRSEEVEEASYKVVTRLEIGQDVILEIPEGIDLPTGEQLELLKTVIVRLLINKEQTT